MSIDTLAMLVVALAMRVITLTTPTDTLAMQVITLTTSINTLLMLMTHLYVHRSVSLCSQPILNFGFWILD